MVACKRCLWVFLFLIIRRPPRSTRTDTLFPYTTLFRSCPAGRSGGIFLRPVRLAVADLAAQPPDDAEDRSEEHTSALQSLMRPSYAVFCLKNQIQSGDR